MAGIRRIALATERGACCGVTHPVQRQRPTTTRAARHLLQCYVCDGFRWGRYRSIDGRWPKVHTQQLAVPALEHGQSVLEVTSPVNCCLKSRMSPVMRTACEVWDNVAHTGTHLTPGKTTAREVTRGIRAQAQEMRSLRLQWTLFTPSSKAWCAREKGNVHALWNSYPTS